MTDLPRSLYLILAALFRTVAVFLILLGLFALLQALLALPSGLGGPSLLGIFVRMLLTNVIAGVVLWLLALPLASRIVRDLH